MPRPILKAASPGHGVVPLSRRCPDAVLHGEKPGKRPRQLRSKAYIDAMSRIDAGSHTVNPAALDAVLKAIAAEFPDLEVDQRPIGIVASCRLGRPFEVHICDLSGAIIQHFESFRRMPPAFERGRALSLNPAYVLVEIYADSVRAISLDGSVSVVDS